MAHLDIGEHPLDSPSGHYIFVMNAIMPFTNCSRQTVARILQAVYYKHHITQAFFMAHIDEEGSQQHLIGYFDPFQKWPTNERGVMKWSRLHKINITNHWILNRGTDFNWFPFRIAMFRRWPTMLPISEMSPVFLRSYFPSVAKYAANYTGFDGIVMGNLAKHFRFTVVPLISNNKYGSKLANLTVTGVTGDLIHNRAEAAFNSRFIIDYEIAQLDFLYPVYSDQYCVVAPGAEPLPKYAATIRCFSTLVWRLLVLMQFVIAVVWGGMRESNDRRQMGLIHDQQQRREDAEKCKGMKATGWRFLLYNFDVYQMFLSHPIQMPRLSRERLFIATCLITDVIIDGIFRVSCFLGFWV